MSNHLFDGLFGSSELNTPFVQTVDGWIRTYGDALETSARLANVLGDLGIVPGDRVAVQVEKSVEAVMLYLACIRAGAVFLPLNTAYTPNELDYFLGDAGAKLFICDPSRRDSLEEIARKNKVLLETLGISGEKQNDTGTMIEKMHLASREFKNVECSPQTLAAILYTSGTTGRSKGAMLNHDNLLSNALALKDYWHYSADDVLLHALPIFHTHGLFVCINITMVSNASLILLPSFDIDVVLEKLPEATTFMGVPTFYTRLLGDRRFNKSLVQHLRLFVSGSAPLLAETHIEFEERTGHRILERYGMTETNMNTSNPYDGERRAGTVGFPLPDVEVRIVDAKNGNAVATGEVGILEVRGPNVFSGYWQMPEKTKEEFREDGFFITGDMALIDEQGYVQIVGRSKDLIISGGYNIYPVEVELVLNEIEGVSETAVIGVPHPDFGEGVVGVVVTTPDSIVDEASIHEGMKDKIARFKQPKRIVIVESLPRNTMGKVQKNVLRDLYGDLFATG